MKRRHLFEWEDQPWLPPVFREFITDHLRFDLESEEARPLHEAIATVLRDAMQKTNTREIVDLCSGSGGPLLAVQRYMASELGFGTAITLTDLYPNHLAFGKAERGSNGTVRAWREPVSAFDVPDDLRGIRTLFTAFHHFRPADAARILVDARVKRRGIAIFEPFERTRRMALILGVGTPLVSMIRTPKLGPMSLARFALTYLLPIAPAIATWDGIVSALRSYTVPELDEMASSAGSEDYRWEAGQVPYATSVGPLALTYLVGVPT